jgi:hypothetical protein
VSDLRVQSIIICELGAHENEENHKKGSLKKSPPEGARGVLRRMEVYLLASLDITVSRNYEETMMRL